MLNLVMTNKITNESPHRKRKRYRFRILFFYVPRDWELKPNKLNNLNIYTDDKS